MNQAYSTDTWFKRISEVMAPNEYGFEGNPDEWLDPNQHSEYFLVVDDIDVNRFVARRILERLGKKVVEAADGFEAIRLWKEFNPICVLMDIRMPGMNGMEATEKIRALENGSRCLIIALTADESLGLKEVCYSSGMDFFLRKPIHPKDLRMVLGSLARKQEERSSWE